MLEIFMSKISWAEYIPVKGTANTAINRLYEQTRIDSEGVFLEMLCLVIVVLMVR